MQKKITKKQKYISQDRSYKIASDDSLAVSLCSLTPDELAPGKDGADSAGKRTVPPRAGSPAYYMRAYFCFQRVNADLHSLRSCPGSEYIQRS